MDYVEFKKKDLSFEDVDGVFITGNEAYLRHSVIDTFAMEEIDRHRVHAQDASPGRVDELLRGTAFEGRPRLVCIVDRDGSFTTSSEDWIRDRFSGERSKNLLCLEAPGIRSNLKIVKWLKKNVLHVECSTPDEERIRTWIRAFFRSEDLAIGSDALETLIDRGGAELTTLRNEMEKLALFGRDRDRVRPGDVERVVIDRRELEFFDFTDAWLTGDHESVLRQIRRQLDRGESDVKITGGLLWAFRRLRSIIELFKMGYRPKGISDELDVQKWIVDKTIRRFKRMDADDLKDVARAFLTKDLIARTGSMDASTALELMVLGGLPTRSREADEPR